MTMENDGAPALELRGLSAGYGDTSIVHDIDLSVPAASVVALLGPNGAGKTTLLHTVAGLIRPTSGRVLVNGAEVTAQHPNRISRAGLCLIPEGRGIFRTLTVKENLMLQVPPWRHPAKYDSALSAFPLLGRRLNQMAGSLSGGEQQMLALARAYLSAPRLVLFDEVSMGLAPLVVEQIFLSIRELSRHGAALLLVEQYVSRALEMADKVYLIQRGRITYEGSPEHLDEAAVMRSYVGAEIGLKGPQTS
jgi:branched-chain amino acid transport system ATP-binding protein